jgi:hypothetical protein
MDRMTRWRDGVYCKACFSERYRQPADVGPGHTMCKQDTWCHFPACPSTAAIVPELRFATGRLKIGKRQREAKLAPNAKRIMGPKLLAAIGPVKKSPLTEDSKCLDSTGA